MADPDLKEKYTNKIFLLFEYTRMARDLKSCPAKYRLRTPDEVFYIKHYHVEMLSENIVSLQQMTEAPNKFWNGKFFLCRTVVISINMSSILTIVEELDATKHSKGAFLSLFNYLHPLDKEQESSNTTLDIGTVVAVKNPQFYKSSVLPFYTIRCDNPSDIILLTEDQLNQCFPDYMWPSEESQNEENKLVSKSTSLSKVEDWLSVGHCRLNHKNYMGAIEAYTVAVNLSVASDLEAVLQRCALNLKLKIYKPSLEDSEKILAQDPNHQQGIYFKCCSLIGLCQYTVAIDCIEYYTKNKACHENSEEWFKLTELLLKAKTFSRQKSFGDYDMKALHSSGKDYLDCADYIGNIAHKFIQGKGIGVVATKDIKFGDLILAEKAFEIAFPQQNIHGQRQMSYDKQHSEFRTLTQTKVISGVAHRLMRNPEICKEFYKLYDGTPRESLQPSSDESCVVDMKKIASICRLNGFGGEERQIEGNDEDSRAQGIWISSCYFNHACVDANCDWSVCGDMLFVKASQNIAKFEELTLSYIPSTEQYDSRLSTQSAYGFVCDCRLCLLDSQEDQAVHNRRTDILNRLDTLQAPGRPNFEQIKALINELEDLRPEYSELNVCILFPLKMLIGKYMSVRKFKTAANIACRTYKLASSIGMIEICLMCCAYAIWCYVQLRNMVKAKQCGIALKACVTYRFGYYNEDLLNRLGPNLGSILAQHKITL